MAGFVKGLLDKITSGIPDLEPTLSKPNGPRDGESSDDSSEDERPTRSRKIRVPKEDTKWKRCELKDMGITFAFEDKQDADATNQSGIQTLSMEERYNKLEGILSEDEFFASDIFQLENGPLTYKAPVTVNVKLCKSISKRHTIKVKMINDGVWTKEDAKFKSGKVQFEIMRLENFVIVGDLVKKKVKIPPEGTTVTVAEDSKIAVEIPSGAVDSDVDVDFKIIPPDATAVDKYLNAENPVCKTVIEVTECLYGDLPSSFKFKKSVTLSLPFVDRPEMKEHTTLMVFRMNGHKIEIVETADDFGLNQDGICKLDVTSFSGYFAGHVRSELVSDKKTIIREVSLLYGSTYVATILMFAEKDRTSTGFPRLWIELVDKSKVDETVVKRTEEMGMMELTNSRSPDVVVYDGYRLRIDIVGNLKGIRGIPKNSYFITYLDVADDNHRLFTVEKKGDFNTCIGIFNFHCDKGPSRQCVHSLQIDTIIGFKRSYRADHVNMPQRQRINSNVSDAVSMRSDFSGYATQSSFSNDLDLYDDHESVCTTDSIGSAASLLEPVCPALSDASLYLLAELVKDDGYKLSIALGMSDEYETNSMTSLGKAAVTCKTLKDWRGKQDEEETIRILSKCLKDAGLKKASKAFDVAVKKSKSI